MKNYWKKPYPYQILSVFLLALKINRMHQDKIKKLLKKYYLRYLKTTLILVTITVTKVHPVAFQIIQKMKLKALL
jgi:hypothetical protein